MIKNILIFMVLWFITTATVNANTDTIGKVLAKTEQNQLEINDLKLKKALWQARLEVAELLAKCRRQQVDCQNSYEIPKNLTQVIVKPESKKGKDATFYYELETPPTMLAVLNNTIKLAGSNKNNNYIAYFNAGDVTPDNWQVKKFNNDSALLFNLSSKKTKTILLFWSN